MAGRPVGSVVEQPIPEAYTFRTRPASSVFYASSGLREPAYRGDHDWQLWRMDHGVSRRAHGGSPTAAAVGDAAGPAPARRRPPTGVQRGQAAYRALLASRRNELRGMGASAPRRAVALDAPHAGASGHDHGACQGVAGGAWQSPHCGDGRSIAAGRRKRGRFALAGFGGWHGVTAVETRKMLRGPATSSSVLGPQSCARLSANLVRRSRR